MWLSNMGSQKYCAKHVLFLEVMVEAMLWQPYFGSHVAGLQRSHVESQWQPLADSSHVSGDHIWSGIPWDIPSQVSGFLANLIPSHIFPATN